MKLKTFKASGIPEAMTAIRQTFGENAVIVSSVRLPDNQVKLIVASEATSLSSDKPVEAEKTKRIHRLHYFQSRLRQHVLPESYFERLVNGVVRKSIKITEEKLLMTAFSEMYAFKPLVPLKKNNVFVFVGNAGCGKTMVVAKMAFQAKLQKLKVACITTDRRKVYGSGELARYMGWMDISCTYLDDYAKLNETVTVLRLTNDIILIDTSAISPYNTQEMKQLKTIKEQLSDADIVYVQSAGMSYQEAQTQGLIFAQNGCSILFATKLDMIRDYGGLLQTAFVGNYRWGGWSSSSKVADRLISVNAEQLGQLITGTLSDKEDE